jgi:hypothetical protein
MLACRGFVVTQIDPQVTLHHLGGWAWLHHSLSMMSKWQLIFWYSSVAIGFLNPEVGEYQPHFTTNAACAELILLGESSESPLSSQRTKEKNFKYLAENLGFHFLCEPSIITISAVSVGRQKTLKGAVTNISNYRNLRTFQSSMSPAFA